VALHGPGGSGWVMTEYPATVEAPCQGETVRIGGSSARRTADGLELTLDERTAPFGRPLRGRVRITAGSPQGPRLNLAEPGHQWQALVPSGHAEVELEAPSARFTGRAYVDANRGDGPLEAAFRRWRWMRVDHPAGPHITYAGERRDGTAFAHALALDAAGTASPWVVAERALPRTRWGVARPADLPSDAHDVRVTTLLDAPFYARSRLAWRESVAGADASLNVVAMHESVDLDRFDAGWVRFLLPFRMRGGW